MANEKILVVDDDTNICELLRLYLTKEGYQVTTANDGEEGLDKFNQVKPDMVLLDVMLPKKDGFEVDVCYTGAEALEKTGADKYDLIILDLNLPRMDGMDILKKLRLNDQETKVLILSARGNAADKIAGLDAGANDYMAKPFHLGELGARVRSLTRRRFIQHDVSLTYGELSFDTRSRRAAAKGEIVILTRKENGILEYLLLNQGRPVSQEELIEHVWDGSVDIFSNSIRVHISSLRKKLRAVLGYDPIINRIGEGYHLGGCDEN